MSPIFTAGRSGAASCTLESGTRDLEIPQPSEGCVAVFCTQIGAILLYQTVCLTLSRRPGYPFIAHTPFPFLSASPCTRFASRLFILRSSIAGCRYCQGLPLACWRKIFLPGPTGERIFRILLVRPGRQSRRQKNNRPSVQDYRRGKREI